MQTLEEGWSPSPLDQAGVTRALEIFDVKPGMKVPLQLLRELLPDTEMALFFAKAYELDYTQLSRLITTLFRTDLISALLGEADGHSSELQDYVIDTVPEDLWPEDGGVRYTDEDPPPGAELLVQLFEDITVEVAASIKEVAATLGDVLESMPSKYGQMTFQHLRQLNIQRNSIGTFGARIIHERTPPRLVVLDVSGSMTSDTIKRIVSEVVSLAWGINASLAIVSNNAFLWEAGTFNEGTVLAAAEFGGTCYETLTPVFDQDWETVITIADYDSAAAAKSYLRSHAKGRVKQVLDISLVDRPTYLAECVGQIADEVRPLLVGNSNRVLR